MYGIRRVQDAQEPGLDVRYPAGAGRTGAGVGCTVSGRCGAHRVRCVLPVFCGLKRRLTLSLLANFFTITPHFVGAMLLSTVCLSLKVFIAPNCSTGINQGLVQLPNYNNQREVGVLPAV